MRSTSSRRLGRGLFAAACAVALTSVAACGSSSTTDAGTGASATTATTVDAALAAMVPDAIKADKKITIGTDSTYAPSEFLAEDGKTIKGFDIDLFTAVAGKLGLAVEFQTAPFDSILPGVDSGKYELGVSSFTINPERVAKVDMVSYFSAGTQWATAAGNPAKVTAADACGKKIAVQKGTVQVDDLAKRSAECTKAGKPAITVDQFDGQDKATAAVVSGKDDAMLADSPVIAYAVQQTNGKLELLGDIYDSAPYGYVVKKNSGKFAEALAKALVAIKADGTYASVLKKWGLEGGAIDTFVVNPGSAGSAAPSTSAAASSSAA